MILVSITIAVIILGIFAAVKAVRNAPTIDDDKMEN